MSDIIADLKRYVNISTIKGVRVSSQVIDEARSDARSDERSEVSIERNNAQQLQPAQLQPITYTDLLKNVPTHFQVQYNSGNPIIVDSAVLIRCTRGHTHYYMLSLLTEPGNISCKTCTYGGKTLQKIRAYIEDLFTMPLTLVEASVGTRKTKRNAPAPIFKLPDGCSLCIIKNGSDIPHADIIVPESQSMKPVNKALMIAIEHGLLKPVKFRSEDANLLVYPQLEDKYISAETGVQCEYTNKINTELLYL